MVYRPKLDPNLVFVLMPFKPPFDSYYDEIIRPAAKSAGLETRKADEIYSTGPIIQDIWKQIWAATIVIADVTEKNPNVNYELGICHTLGVPTVIITQSFDDVPFDYRHRRCIRYDTKDVNWQRKLKKSITATLKQVLAGEDIIPELSWPYETSQFPQEQKVGSLVPARDARDVVLRGVRMIRDAIAYAFGPQGAQVSVNAGANQQQYYKQGVPIARAVHSSERLEEIGIDHARWLAQEMSDRVGDGSKTAVLLFEKMLDFGHIALKRNHPHSDVLRGMERATEAVVASIAGQGKTANKDSLTNIARTAAGGDLKIARLVVEAYAKAGRDGVVVIEQSNALETVLELQEGMSFDRGYIDPAFLFPTEAQEIVLDDAYILIHELRISSMKDFLPLLEQVVETKRPLLVVADDVEGEALATLVLNRKKGVLNCVAVKAPGYADRRKALLQDIGALTEATPITLSSGRTIAGVTLKDLGHARKIIVTKDGTSILGGAGESNIGKHLGAIKEELARSNNSFDIEKLRERMANLSGAIASIRIGGISAQDRIDASYAAESAMHSVQQAIEEGFVVGGGLSLLRAKARLNKLSFKRRGEVAGVKVIADALQEPLRQLLLNSKFDPADRLAKIERAKNLGIGFNAETGDLQDLDTAGVFDPVTIVTHSVQLAFSHVKTLLSTGAWDRSASEPKKPAAVPQGDTDPTHPKS
jgi:chaperonin GroEL